MKVFPVCGQSCGQGRISVRFHDPLKSRKRPCCKAFRASASPVVDAVHSTPKAGALPTALHPVIQFSGDSVRSRQNVLATAPHPDDHTLCIIQLFPNLSNGYSVKAKEKEKFIKKVLDNRGEYW